MKNISLKIFWTFFKVGTFTLGGGYAMLPIIEDEIVGKKKWLSKEEFLESVVIAQSSPGVLAVNTAIITGYRVAGKNGVFFGILGSVLPSYIIILLLSKVILLYRDSVLFTGFFSGVKPATVALIFIAVYKIGKSAMLNQYTIAIPIITAFIIHLFKISPIIVLLIIVILGNIYFNIKELKK